MNGQIFKDVDQNTPFYSHIKKAKDAGVIKGDDGYFRPNDNITRGELMAILSRAGIFDKKDT